MAYDCSELFACEAKIDKRVAGRHRKIMENHLNEFVGKNRGVGRGRNHSRDLAAFSGEGRESENKGEGRFFAFWVVGEKWEGLRAGNFMNDIDRLCIGSVTRSLAAFGNFGDDNVAERNDAECSSLAGGDHVDCFPKVHLADIFVVKVSSQNDSHFLRMVWVAGRFGEPILGLTREIDAVEEGRWSRADRMDYTKRQMTQSEMM
jgi:hypothetical protein